MWWFALIYLVNSLTPSELLFDYLAVNIGFMRVTVIDLLVFTGPLICLFPGWRTNRWNTGSLHPAYFAAMILLCCAVVYGATKGLLYLQPETYRWYLQPFRNLLLVPVGMFMAHQCLSHPGQIRKVVWILFWGSIASAMLSLYYANATTERYVAGESYGFDELRASALQVSGDAGMVAACLMIYCWVSGINFIRSWQTILAFSVGALGMFFIPHRSSWLVYAIGCLYSGFYVWPSQMGRKIVLSTISISGILFLAVLAIGVMQTRTGHDFGDWVEKRLASLLPSSQDDGSNDRKAWDTRVPGLQQDLEVWSKNLMGGGFAVHEYNILKTGNNSGSLRHTPWTSTLAETGPIGVAAFMVVIVGGIVVGLRLARQSTDGWSSLVGLMITTSSLVAFVMGFLSLSWNAPRGALALGLLAGIGFRCRELALAMAAYNTPQESEEAWFDQHLLSPAGRG